MKRILIIRCGALGDLVTSTSVIDAMKLQFGEDTIIDFVSTPSSGSILKNDPRVNTIFPLKHKKIPLLFSNQKKAIVEHSKKYPYDYLINFERGKQFEKLVKTMVATKKIGHFFTQVHGLTPTTHAAQLKKMIFQEIVSPEVLEKSFPRLIGTTHNDLIKKYKLPKNYIIISPSNSHQKKKVLNHRAWPTSSWSTLIQKLAKKMLVVIIGNKGEDNFFRELQPYPLNVIDLVGKTLLSDLIGIIENANALVSTDTGTAHISSAVNTEVFTLIGPTPAAQTGPFQTPFNKVHIISTNLECSPCYRTDTMKKCQDNICMKEITPEHVFDTITSEL